MILGLGTDIVDIRRIEKILHRFGDRFLAKAFTTNEIAACRSRFTALDRQAAFLAKRFAAKEACVKALGTGFSGGIALVDIEIGSHESGRPCLTLSGQAARSLNALMPHGMEADLFVSLSDDFPMAQAVVILSCRPLSPLA